MMRPSILAIGFALGLGLLAPGTVLAQSRTGVEMGRTEFISHCATCHGIDGLGDGPMRPFLARPPSNLSTLAIRNRGVYPRLAVSEIIDGRGIEGPGPHGTRDMPIWGQVYRDESQQQLRGTPFPPEWSVRGRIMALVEYLETLQQK